MHRAYLTTSASSATTPRSSWYFGDNRLTQDPEDFITEVGSGWTFQDSSVAERQQYLTIAVRDYLNAGGKLIHAGETVGYTGSCRRRPARRHLLRTG